MKQLIANLRALGPVKLGAMGAVAVAVLGLMAALVLTGGPSPSATLYSGLGLKDASHITETLKAAHIRYAIGNGGHSVLVTPAQLDEARLLLAQHNLPAGSSNGFAIFDHKNPLLGSSFLNRIDETRALDSELERTINLIHGVEASRVQVVLPRRDEFSLSTAPAQASVMLSLAGVGPLDHESVEAILNLVASAVPGLKPNNISIVDNRGDLLAQAGRTDNSLLSSRDAALKQSTERQLSEAVRSMLAAVVGPNQVRVVTAVSMDFDRSEQTSTTYNPNGQVVRSQQQTRSKSSRSSGTNKTVSVSNNLPGATSSKAGPKRLDTQSKSTQTTNYEISQDVKHIVHATPQITRISVAVMLDDVKTTNPKGKVIWTPRSPAQVAQIRKLVETAIGYDKSRGDVVDVQSLQFAPNELPVSAKRSLIGRFLSSGLLMPLLRLLLTAGIGIAALLVVFRPMVRRIITPPENATAEPALLAEQNGAIAGPATTEETNPVKVIADLIDRHPEASVAILRDWLGQEGAR